MIFQALIFVSGACVIALIWYASDRRKTRRHELEAAILRANLKAKGVAKKEAEDWFMKPLKEVYYGAETAGPKRIDDTHPSDEKIRLMRSVSVGDDPTDELFSFIEVYKWQYKHYPDLFPGFKPVDVDTRR